MKEALGGSVSDRFWRWAFVQTLYWLHFMWVASLRRRSPNVTFGDIEGDIRHARESLASMSREVKPPS